MPESDATKQEIRFHGNLGPGDEQAARFAASITYDQYDPTTLNVEILWLGNEESNRVAAQKLSIPRSSPLPLYAEDPLSPDVELLGISKITTGGNRARIRTDAIRVGITRDPSPRDASYLLKVELQPSGILCIPAISEMSYTGDIRTQKILEGKVEIQTAFGLLEACERYEYITTLELGNKITHSVRRASITGNIRLPAGTSLFEIDEKLQHDLDDICLSLSLCYRQRVDYYEIRYHPVPNRDHPTGESDSLVRIRWNTLRQKVRGDELINVRTLVSGGLQRLISSIRNSPENEAIRRGIRFLAASYPSPFETAYFMAFSAMEALVDACLPAESKNLVKAAEWKKIESELRSSLDKLQLGEPGDLMKSKLSELRRAPLASRIEDACRRMAPKTEDLWPSMGFAAGLATAARMRNELFHSARLQDDLGEMSRNLVRIRTLTERLLLKRLEWPDDQIWNWYDQNLKWANAN